MAVWTPVPMVVRCRSCARRLPRDCSRRSSFRGQALVSRTRPSPARPIPSISPRSRHRAPSLLPTRSSALHQSGLFIIQRVRGSDRLIVSPDRRVPWHPSGSSCSRGRTGLDSRTADRWITPDFRAHFPNLGGAPPVAGRALGSSRIRGDSCALPRGAVASPAT